jgi:hypothetical protein
MDKRYQVFVSSTYTDLKEERQLVIRAVMELDCIPAGMELFPAADEEQFEFIKRVIDDCDYYLLIVGGRYGTITEKGVSFTEQEYDYAISLGLKVIALLHENPEEIPLGKSEKDEALREKLQNFRDRVSKGRLVKYWKSPDDLAGKVALSLSQTIRMYPAVGWVRANIVANEQILNEINVLRKRDSELLEILAAQRAELDQLKSPPALADLAGLDEEITLWGRYWSEYQGGNPRGWHVATTWRKIFRYIAPYLVSHPSSETVKGILASASFKESATEMVPASLEQHITLNDQNFQTVGVQLKALGLVKIEYTENTAGGMGLYWSFTAAGERLMVELRTVRTKTPAAGDKSKSVS